MSWFRNKIRKNISPSSVEPQKFLKDDKLVRTQMPLPGRMYTFVYDPKGKETLPYYDSFPMILMVGPSEGGFYGLNLHYLPPRIRARLMDRLLEHASNDKMDETTRIKLSYSMLSGVSKLRDFAPCFKHYLKGHIRSQIMQIPFPEWDIAIFLPTERFSGASKSEVWKNSVL